MPVIIVVGIQWGDEGKGKVVDYLTERANLVVRFQGGHNAGHTVVVEGEKTALRLIPSGILRKDTRCLLAAGVVVDPVTLLEEIEMLSSIGVDPSPARLGVAGEVQLILPYHQALDIQREEALAGGKIGTTGKGIGPAYEDTVSRFGIRLADTLDSQNLRELLERNVELKNRTLREVFKCDTQFNADKLYDSLSSLADRMAPYISNVSQEVHSAIEANHYVMFEGAQGCLLDIHHGTYPFVTSSNTVAGFACASAGFGPGHVDTVLGICKAYCTRVGSGPFPTEDFGNDGEVLRKVGHEFGTVTGRPRRCGWFDSVAVRRAVRLNGINSLMLTKLDVLSGFEKIKLGTGYTLNGQPVDDLSPSWQDIDKLEVGYEEVDGWTEDIGEVRDFAELPQAAKNLVQRIEQLVGCEVGGFSVGPDRVQTILRSGRIRNFTLL